MTFTDPDGDERWRRFMAATRGRPPWPSLVRAAAMFDEPGEALDVGAGAGRDTAHLLSRGWRVTALDSSPASAAAMAELAHPRLTFVAMPAQDFVPGRYDLVNAQYSLPFLPREEFVPAVLRLRDSVRPGGVMAATFFAPNDEWNVPGTEVTFSTRVEVESMFGGWSLVELTEIEEDGQVADGSPKHWHLFHVVARRPAGPE